MVKKIAALGIVVGCLLSVVGLFGCGQQSSPSTTVTSAVTVSGAVTASQSDLQQLGAGVSTLSIKDNVSDLTSRGVPLSSIKALNLRPFSVGSTTITVGTLNSDGSVTQVATADVDSKGSYEASIPNYDSSKTYSAIVTKTSTDTNKTLEMKVIYPAASGGKISGSDAVISPQTTLVAQMIIEKVVKVLESAKVDPTIIANVKDAIISAVDALITSGTISLSTVRDSTATENTSLTTALDKASNDSSISSNLDSIKGALSLAKADDLDSAKGAIFGLFKTMLGDPRGVPEEMINALATSFRNGVTKSTSDLVTAINKSMFNKTDPTKTVSGSITVSQLGGQIQGMLQAAYGSAGGHGESMPDGVKSVINATFPKATWASAAVTSSTTFSVPQMIIIVFATEHLLEGSTTIGFSPAQMAYNLGLMSGVENKAKIMHSELRITTYQEWQGFQPSGEAQQPPSKSTLMSWVDVGNVVSPSPTETAGYTCTLTYPTASGTNHVDFTDMSSQKMGGEGMAPGWKTFAIQPFGGPDGSSGVKVTDFVPGTATITVKNASGGTVDTKTIEIVNVDLTRAKIMPNIPKDAWINNPSGISTFSKGSQPNFNWALSSEAITLPAGYRLGYSIQVMKGKFQNDPMGNPMFFVNWGDPNARIFDSWDKQDFPEAIQGSDINWQVPSTLTDEAFYNFNLSVVVINKKTNQAVAESQPHGSIFMVGSPTIPAAFKTQQSWTAPVTRDISTATITLEGKVHEQFLTFIPAGTTANFKVGLFREQYVSGKGSTVTIVDGVTPVSLTKVVGHNYYTFKLFFLGSVFGANYGQYRVIAWNDANNNGTWDSASENWFGGQKGIDHRSDGTRTSAPDGSADLLDSLTNFDFVPFGQTFN